MPTLQHVELSQFDQNDPVLNELYGIFRDTLQPEISYREFNVYFFKHKPHLIDISFIKEGNRTIGFISVSFYRVVFHGSPCTICRSAIGILEAFRGGRLPNSVLCWKFMKYKFKHPGEQVFITGFMANPLIYSMICKHAARVYPKRGGPIPFEIENLRSAIVKHYALRQKDDQPFVMKIHFQVHLNETQASRIFNSVDKDVQYYLEINPNFQEQQGVLTIVPVDWGNIFVSINQVLFFRPVTKQLLRAKAFLQKWHWQRWYGLHPESR